MKPINSNDRKQARSCLFPIEEGSGRKLVGRTLAASSPTKLPDFALIAVAPDRRRRPAGGSAALPLNQVAQTISQYEGRGAQLDDLYFASRDEKVEGTATYARKPTGIGNPHADRLDCKW